MANVPITKFAGNDPFDANVSTGVAKLIGFRLAFTLWGISEVERGGDPRGSHRRSGKWHTSPNCREGAAAR